jgi:hypothetical protein
MRSSPYGPLLCKLEFRLSWNVTHERSRTNAGRDCPLPIQLPPESVTPTKKKLCPWAEVPQQDLHYELVHRNGRFQQLLGWMRHSLQANAVLDSSGRIIFINRAAEELWWVRIFDVQGDVLMGVFILPLILSKDSPDGPRLFGCQEKNCRLSR